MKYYLAELALGRYLARLPARIEFASATNKTIRGVLGKEECDVSKLREPIHRVFVNWPSDPQSVLAFTKKYGLVERSGKYSWYAANEDEVEFTFSVSEWVDLQDSFKEYWDWNSTWGTWDVVRSDIASELLEEDVGNAPRLCHPGVATELVSLSGPRPFFVVYARTLWQDMLACLAFHRQGVLRRCENPECSAPRFIARRKNQIFCSNDCAALVAKRRWWAKHGEEWRKRRNRKSRKGGKR